MDNNEVIRMRNTAWKRLPALCLTVLLCCILAAEALAADAPTFILRTESGDSEVVQMVTPGVVYSIVKSDGQDVRVLTSDLEWDSGAEVNRRVAYINAPRTGRSVVLNRPSGSGHSLGRYGTGKIVIVAEAPKGQYTGVVYKNSIGYVLTSTLSFPDLSNGVLTGTVTWTDGTVDGRRTINLRQKAKKSSRKITSIKTGASVVIYSQNNNWAEVDVNGWHGYIMTKYLSINENDGPTIVEQPAATEAPIPVREEEVEESLDDEDSLEAEEAAIEAEADEYGEEDYYGEDEEYAEEDE